ncbi:hypothetical protein [Phenylobacterium kunshanense]|uniref:Uncharacterized protein n=1 Tax=Phenylobacterium kunshanense TaxID=1445034 RepID=A0A328BFV7_9CAUL|nr:hypothetical protein [Phenylobacterium kunshanense]RAK65451.1 hypothetical protein DJ019_10825 [Phenylobacterium kunshanense]
MATPAAPSAPDPDELMLARLAEMDMAAAVEAHARMMAAETADEFNDLGRTYQRMARSARQSIALKARLKREREQPARPERPPLSHDCLPARVRNHIDRASALALRFTERDAPEGTGIDEIDLVDALIAIAVDDGEAAFLGRPTESLAAEALRLVGRPRRTDRPPPRPDPKPTVLWRGPLPPSLRPPRNSSA